jgi:peptide/nickel transport system permease protein
LLAYIGRRALLAVFTVWAISVLSFAIIQLPPGDYVTSYIAQMAATGSVVSEEEAETLRIQYGLGQPMYVQYLKWMGLIVQGNFGMSMEWRRPVTEVIGERLWLTVVVSVSALILTWVLALPIGIYSAVRQYSIGDYAATFIGFIGLAVPNFLLALVLLYVGKVYFGLSIGGLMDPEYIDQPMSWGKVGSILQHLIIPVIVIGMSGTAGMIRRLRANLLDELQKQYVVTGRAKGLPPLRLLIKYPLRHAINPFVADIGGLLPDVISGSVIVSVVLSLPTTGPMLLGALKTQDVNLAATFLLFVAALTVVGMLISDLALAALDPRIRFGATSEK